MKAGIYLARPTHDEMVPVTLDRRYVDTCAVVNNQNVKIGKAKDIDRRHKNYLKDFGDNNIDFIPLAYMHEGSIHAAEMAIMNRLKRYRMTSPKGRPMEWLKGIESDEAIRLVYKVLDTEGIEFSRPEISKSTIEKQSPVENKSSNDVEGIENANLSNRDKPVSETTESDESNSWLRTTWLLMQLVAQVIWIPVLLVLLTIWTAIQIAVMFVWHLTVGLFINSLLGERK